MPHAFTARVAGVDEDPELESLSAGVAENLDGTGRSLVFQCSLDEFEDDEEAGDDYSHCLVLENGAVAYGCVTEIVLDGPRLTVVLDAAAAAGLHVDDHIIDVTLDIEAQAREELRGALRRILSYGRPDAVPHRMEL
ncbi:Imm10 family immunity protein [Nonomuraea sp. NPDC003727]